MGLLNFTTEDFEGILSVCFSSITLLYDSSRKVPYLTCLRSRQSKIKKLNLGKDMTSEASDGRQTTPPEKFPLTEFTYKHVHKKVLEVRSQL